MALVRYVKRGGGDPEVGVLTPPRVWVDPKEGVGWWGGEGGREGGGWPPYLVYNRLPFQEDLRAFSFRSLSDPQGRHFATEEEREAGLAVVDALTLPARRRAGGMALRLGPHPWTRAAYRAALEKGLSMEEGKEEEEGGEEGGRKGGRGGSR